MKLTQNRRLILKALSDSDGYDLPPYSARNIHYMLKDAFAYKSGKAPR